ncbi:MAG: ABC transporter substrate-binding protein [Anaeroplasma sp.]
MKLKRFALGLGLATLAVTSLASCKESPNEKNAKYNKAVGASQENDDDLYDAALGDFYTAYTEALKKTTTAERFAYMAKSEAELLASGVFLPTTTQGGNYAITKVAPRTAPYALWGTDEYRYKNLVITNEFIKKTDREALLDKWNSSKGTDEYDSVAYAKEYLTSKGYTFKNSYTRVYTEGTATWDWLATSMASDSEVLVNIVDGLVEYNGENELVPALAESLPTKKVNDNGTATYTFKIRPGVYWANATDGTKTSHEVVADDFVAGFQHMLDAAGGLEYLVEGVIVNASEYLAGVVTDFSKVGVKAVDKYTLEYTTVKDLSYFETYLSYNIFQPLCRAYFEEKGGAFGREAYATASASTSYTYGTSKDNVLTCGAYYVKQHADDSTIEFDKNANYWAYTDTDATNDPSITNVKWLYVSGDNQLESYNYAKDGTTDGVGLNTAAITQAQTDGLFDTYAYVADTTATTYFAGINLNRQTYVLPSGAVCTTKSTNAAKITYAAVNNKNFRLALNRAFDKANQNAQSVGETLQLNSLRNMYTPYDYCSLDADVTISGKKFAAGTSYGEITQYYLTQLGVKDVDLHDGNNSWYNPTEAKAYMDKALEELGDVVGKNKIEIDIFYYAASGTQTKMANSYKTSVEGVLGDYVQVNLIEANTPDDYYACGYRAANGAAANYDVFYGSGWGPDYGDPSTYLDTFLPEGAGYMTKVIGLW